MRELLKKLDQTQAVTHPTSNVEYLTCTEASFLIGSLVKGYQILAVQDIAHLLSRP
jgi:hypothetical protein